MKTKIEFIFHHFSTNNGGQYPRLYLESQKRGELHVNYPVGKLSNPVFKSLYWATWWYEIVKEMKRRIEITRMKRSFLNQINNFSAYQPFGQEKRSSLSFLISKPLLGWIPNILPFPTNEKIKQLKMLVFALRGVWIDVCKMCFSVGRIFT